LPLVSLAGSPHVSVRIEAIAALANLAVNDANESEIVRAKGLVPIVNSASMAALALQNPNDRTKGLMEELAAQSARALRNLSVNRKCQVSLVTYIFSFCPLYNCQSQLECLCAMMNDYFALRKFVWNENENQNL